MPRCDVLVLERSAATALVRARTVARPEEACGVLLGLEGREGPVVSAIGRVPNRSPTPRTGYAMTGADLLPWFRDSLDLEVMGFYHSHPDAGPFPSTLDVELSRPDWWYVIVGSGDPGECEMAAWRDGRPAEVRVRGGGGRRTWPT